jgi:hypothetical protein
MIQENWQGGLQSHAGLSRVICNSKLCVHFLIRLSILDSAAVQLWRYEDPELGPRKMPEFGKPLAGKVLIEPSSVFSINLDSKEVTISVGKSSHKLGSQIIYIVA